MNPTPQPRAQRLDALFTNPQHSHNSLVELLSLTPHDGYGYFPGHVSQNIGFNACYEINRLVSIGAVMRWSS